MQAADVMTTHVLPVAPDAIVADIAQVLVQNRISALPVIDPDGRVVGVVSEGDLIRRVEAEAEDHPDWWLSLVAEAEDLAATVVEFRGLKVRDVMTSPAITVEEDVELGAVAEILVTRRIKRVPVVRNEKLVGIVSRSDVLAALVGLKAHH